MLMNCPSKMPSILCKLSPMDCGWIIIFLQGQNLWSRKRTQWGNSCWSWVALLFLHSSQKVHIELSWKKLICSDFRWYRKFHIRRVEKDKNDEILKEPSLLPALPSQRSPCKLTARYYADSPLYICFSVYIFYIYIYTNQLQSIHPKNYLYI